MQTDRLAILTGQLATMIEAVDVEANLPPPIRAAAKLMRTFGRVDLVATVRATVLAWVVSLPAWAEAEPDRAETVAKWAADVLAWLRGETDDPPPALTL
jgi:hypothetical protein